MKFHCNISNGMVRGMRFENGFFETNDPDKIEFLTGFGGQDGCIITPQMPIEEPSDIKTAAAEDVKPDEPVINKKKRKR